MAKAKNETKEVVKKNTRNSKKKKFYFRHKWCIP